MKKKSLLCIILFMLSIIFTLLVVNFDVRNVGVNETNIGFAGLNTFIFNKLGTSNVWYNITEVLGYIALILVFIYGLYGAYDLIKKRSIFKVNKHIIILGVFYIIVFGLYILFENIIINYRPILVDGALEASYPSSHTLLSICVFGSSILINKKLFANKKINKVNIILMLMMILTVIGRLLSGMHWFTDIIGGVLISSFLLASFNLCITCIKNYKKVK